MSNVYDGFVGTTGKIVRVSLRNFLNHESLDFECFPNFNVVFGKNGQGKSAIVQAIALCFGSEGKNAGRNSTLINYIKDYYLPEAQNRTAVIEVTLSNSGPNPYEFDIRGPFLTLVRTINRNSSNYYIKGKGNRREQINKRKLMDYLSHIKINIKSPLVYMDQEMSKKIFLHSNDHSFYNYYQSAAGLDAMAQAMELEKNNLEQTRVEIERRQAAFIPEREVLNQFCQSVTKFESQIDEWEKAKINYKLAEFRDAKAELDKLNNKLEEIGKMTSANQIKTLEREISTVKGQLGNTKYQLESLATQAVTLRESNKGHNEAMSSVNSNVFRFENKKKLIEDEIERLTAEISRHADGNDNDKVSEEKESELLNDKLNKLNERLRELESEYDIAKAEASSISEQLRGLEYTRDNLKDELADIRSKMKSIKSEDKKDSSSSEINRAYEYNVDAILQKLEKMYKNGEFESKPLGPIGLMIKVKPSVEDTRIYSIIERHVGKVNTGFLVVSENDSKKLRRVLESSRCPVNKIRIIKTNLFKYSNRVERPARKSNYLNIDEMNNVLLQFLIKSNHLLDAAIFPRYKEMHSELSNPDSFIKIGFTLDKVGHGKRVHSSLFFPACHESEYRPPKFIKVQSELLNKESDLNSLLKSQGQTVKSLAESNQKIGELKGKLNELNKKIDHYKSDNLKLYREKIVLENSLVQFADSRSNNLDNSLKLKWEARLKELQEELKQVNEKYDKFNRERNVYLDKIKNNTNLLDSVLVDVAELKTSFKEWQTKLETLTKELGGAKKTKSTLGDEITSVKSKIKHADERVSMLRRKLDEDGIDIEQYPVPKLAIETYYGLIQARKSLLKKMVQDASALDKSKATTIQEYVEGLKKERDELEDRLKVKQDKLNEIVENFTLGKENFHHRSEKFSKIKQKNRQIAKKFFKDILESICNYQGNLVFNDVERTLGIQIFNKQQSPSKTHVTTNLKTLSGGERSSIQLSLLLSIATISYSPLHIFDEIDVYMDQSTRMKNIEALLDFASNNPSRQFFLVTPHYEFARYIADNHSHISKIFNVGQL